MRPAESAGTSVSTTLTCGWCCDAEAWRPESSAPSRRTRLQRKSQSAESPAVRDKRTEGGGAEGHHPQLTTRVTTEESNQSEFSFFLPLLPLLSPHPLPIPLSVLLSAASFGSLSLSMLSLPEDQVVLELQRLVDRCRHGATYCKQVLSLYRLSKVQHWSKGLRLLCWLVRPCLSLSLLRSCRSPSVR